MIRECVSAHCQGYDHNHVPKAQEQLGEGAIVAGDLNITIGSQQNQQLVHQFNTMSHLQGNLVKIAAIKHHTLDMAVSAVPWQYHHALQIQVDKADAQGLITSFTQKLVAQNTVPLSHVVNNGKHETRIPGINLTSNGNIATFSFYSDSSEKPSITEEQATMLSASFKELISEQNALRAQSTNSNSSTSRPKPVTQTTQTKPVTQTKPEGELKYPFLPAIIASLKKAKTNPKAGKADWDQAKNELIKNAKSLVDNDTTIKTIVDFENKHGAVADRLKEHWNDKDSIRRRFNQFFKADKTRSQIAIEDHIEQVVSLRNDDKSGCGFS